MPQGDPDPDAMTLMRLRDPNEALGLAVRLLAGEAPFHDMGLGMSTGLLVGAIDCGRYAFVRRGAKAVGFAAWLFTTNADAEAWLFNGQTPEGGVERLDGGPVAIMLAVQGIDTSAVRFLIRHLRDGDLGQCNTLYYMRDYGPDGRGRRAVRLVRPKVRRAHHSMPNGAPQVRRSLPLD